MSDTGPAAGAGSLDPPTAGPGGAKGPLAVAIAADHNGLALKAALAGWLRAAGHRVDDRGTFDTEVVDYPPLCADLCRQVQSGAAEFGIVVGGSGSGEQIACNKMRGIRAALCESPWVTEIARSHNDANVMVLGAKVLSEDLALELLRVWLRNDFEGGRHQRRLDQVAALERGEVL